MSRLCYLLATAEGEPYLTSHHREPLMDGPMVVRSRDPGARMQVQIDHQSSALGLGRLDAHDCTLAGYGIVVDLAVFEH